MRFFKITKAQAQEIIDNTGNLTRKELSSKYGISEGHVSNIINGRRIFDDVIKSVQGNYELIDKEEVPVYDFDKNGYFDLSAWAKAMSY